LDAAFKRAASVAGPIAALMMVGDTVVYDRGVRGAGDRTAFKTASCAKWLIAATVMALVDEGRIELDAPLRAYLSSFDGEKANITVRQLLTHTSGLPQRLNPAHERIGSLEKAVTRLGERVPLKYAPGERFCYGNLSYQVAARVAEVVTGEPWHDVFASRIAAPVGMVQTVFPREGLGRGINQAETTLVDYVAFLKMFQNRGVSDAGVRVLSEASVAEMMRDQTAGVEMGCINRRTHEKMDRRSYGLGLWREHVDPLTDRR
jgi:CubicO group peptidase (beta-lactamase class C family)